MSDLVNKASDESIDALVESIYKKIVNSVTQNTVGLSEELSGRAATIFSSKLSANNWRVLRFFGAESPYLWYSRGYLPSERPKGARRQVAL